MMNQEHPTLELRRPSLTRAVTSSPGPAVESVRRRDRRPTRDYDWVVRPGLEQEPVQLRFGEWMVRQGLLTRAQLLRALATSHLHDWRVGDAVVVLGIAQREQVETEAGRFEQQIGGEGQDREALEQQLRWLELQALARRAVNRPVSGRRADD